VDRQNDDPLNSVDVRFTEDSKQGIKRVAAELGVSDIEVLRRILLIHVPVAAKEQKVLGRKVTVTIERVRVSSGQLICSTTISQT
jgi:hypothetical protein